jgi:putative nucleotidyltransferase with HDIG domain
MSQSDQDIRNRLLLARLPAMPQILLKLLELCQDDGAGMAELAKLIANDVGMTTKILGVANSSAYYRGGRKVGLLQALSTLGSDLIKTLVISESVLQTFNGFPHSGASDLRAFWKHSLTTAVIAREISKKMNYAQVEEAYLAGLLHDVGRLALLAAAPNEYSVNFQAQDNAGLCDVEQQTMHISHSEAGAWLIERWNLDSFMADSILYHHEVSARVEAAHPLIRIVHLANWLANQDPEMPLAADAGLLCAITDEDLLFISQGAAAQVKKSAAYLGIDLSGVDSVSATKAMVPVAPPILDPLQQRLTDEVLNMALMAELARSFTRQKSDSQLLDVIRQNVRILCNLEDTLVLLTNGGGDALVGVSVGEQWQRLSEFSVSFAGGGGLADCAQQGHLIFLSRDSVKLTLPEEQLLRVFGVDCLVCVPLASGTRRLGVMVGAVPTWQVADLKRREKFLQLFGAQAALALDAASRERGEIDSRIAGVKQEFLDSSRRVVHEVNNPLSIIKNYLSVLDDKLHRHEPVAGELSILNEEIDRVGNIMREFAGAAPKVQEHKTEVNQVVNDLVRLFRESRFLPSTVQVVTKPSEHACEIDGSVDTLKQILVNLLKNAIEAMPDGGLIEIINAGRVPRNGRDYYALRIKDNGSGMPASVLAKLFSPVQSAKAGENRGLGLSIVHRLVKTLNGSIDCVSTDAGTVFEMLLPASMAVGQRVEPARGRDAVELRAAL